jgi:hypothetical protein
MAACARGPTVDRLAPEPAVKARSTDLEPRIVQLASPLPAGRVEAFFALDTGGDQMTLARKEAGLVVVVRFDRTELRRTIASCREAALGSVLGGGTETVLEVAGCDGEYWLISEPRQVRVDRVAPGGATTPIARTSLPSPELRAVSPRASERDGGRVHP